MGKWPQRPPRIVIRRDGYGTMPWTVVVPGYWQRTYHRSWTEAKAWALVVLRRWSVHLRDHLNDGRWYPECVWCQNRRRYGGLGFDMHSSDVDKGVKR